MIEKVDENNIVYIVVAKCLKDSYKEIQLVTKDKQYAVDFVENNYCDFQERIFDLAYIKAFALDSYLGEIDDYVEKDEHELVLNPKYESLSYYWDWDNSHFIEGTISIDYLQKRLYV